MLRLKRRMQSRGFRKTKGVTRISSKNRKKKVCIYLSTVLLRHPPVLKCPSSRGQMILMYPDMRIKITCSKSSLSFDNTRWQREGEGARKGILDLKHETTEWQFFLCQVLVTSWLDVLVSQSPFVPIVTVNCQPSFNTLYRSGPQMVVTEAPAGSGHHEVAGCCDVSWCSGQNL